MRDSFACGLLIYCLSLNAGPIGVVPGRILIKAKPGSHPGTIAEAAAEVDGQPVDEISGTEVKVLRVPHVALDRVLRQLRQRPDIEFAEPDRIIAPDLLPSDPYYGSQWHLPKIQADSAWEDTTGNSTIVIAILDTGVDSSHPDLAGKLVAGWNFYNGNSDTSDVLGHGTAVAGTAAAISNNGLGVAGVAWNCRIMPLRISDTNGYAYDSTIAKALNWAADHGARVANISFGAAESSTVASSALNFQNKGGVVAISSGNSGIFSSQSDNPAFLVISASDQNDAIATWSNTGNNIDLAAPGVNILTLARGGGYAWWSGTSFSAPIVSGVAALVLSAQPALSGAQATQILKSSADDFGAVGIDPQYGAGRVNAANAVTLALATPVSPAGDIIPPVVQITSPTEGAYVYNSVTVYVSTSDNKAVTKVELYVDGKLISSSSRTPFSTNWNCRKAFVGAHGLQVKAYDAAGNEGVSQNITIYKQSR